MGANLPKTQIFIQEPRLHRWKSGQILLNILLLWSRATNFEDHVTQIHLNYNCTSFAERKQNLPDSQTMLPGFSSSIMVMSEMSVEYRIWVRWGRLTVQSSGVGWRTYTQPPLLQVTLEPYLFPMRSEECRMTPYFVWVWRPCSTFTGNIESWPKKTIAVSPSWMVSRYSRKLIAMIL